MADSKIATERLREMLDARGVEHEDKWSGDISYTKWQGIGGMWFIAHDSFGTDGELLYIEGINMTPELAIAATLGSGECDTHWHELFGTPERAARTLRTLIEDGPFLVEESRDSLKPASVCNLLNELCGGCGACPSLTGVRESECSIAFECDGGDYDALLEWLNSDLRDGGLDTESL